MNKNILSAMDTIENLAVIVLGGRKSGKSHTWNTMFDRTVKTGTKLHQLDISGERIDVFLVSGSPEERKKHVGDIIIDIFLVSGSPEERGLYVDKIITVQKPRIVLCSVQDIPEASTTFKYFVDKGFFIFIHWLNPGYKQDKKPDSDVNQLLNLIPQNSFISHVKNGNDNPQERVQEMKDFIYSWAKRKSLLKSI